MTTPPAPSTAERIAADRAATDLKMTQLADLPAVVRALTANRREITRRIALDMASRP